MKVIFLDVDGVLNTASLLYHYGIHYIDEDLVDLFSTIVEKTGAEIVLSSTWRLKEGDRGMVSSALARRGMEIHGATPRIHNAPRAEEIKKWLSERPEVDRYAILDDDLAAGIGMENNFFPTDFEIGLEERTAARIVRHLGLKRAS